MASVRITSMGFVAAMAVIAVFTFSPLICAQNARQSGAAQSATKSEGASKNQQAAPDHIYPEPVDYWKQAATAGLEALNRNKPNGGNGGAVLAENNDPVFICDPQGLPREDLYELRTTQIYQTPEKIVMLYTFGRAWRVIWLDGRELPKDPEPRWYGYSVGKWVDDTTLLVESNGLDERTWIDRAGRPHSSDLRLEERFHRVDHDHLELSVTIIDPPIYTKPWVALDKMRFEIQPDDFDVREFICAPSEYKDYNKEVGDPASTK
jgi:hypothetical protein